MAKRYVELIDAVLKMNELHNDDIRTNGYEAPDAFDNRRAIDALKELATVDAEEVVRCRDCRYRIQSVRVDKRPPGGLFVYGCEKVPGGYFGEIGYCSLGEKE